MEEKLKSALQVSYIKLKGLGGSGCISEGQVFETDNGLMFLKLNKKPKAKLMFDGEFESLITIKSTETIRVPHPLKVVDLGSQGTGLVMEYIKMQGSSNCSAKLGKQLATMHLFNTSLKSSPSTIHKEDDTDSTAGTYVNKFGFNCSTCCGYISQENSWKTDWVEFYAQQRLDFQIKMVLENDGNREISELWSGLSLKLPHFFEGIEVEPALLHGDLWSGNVGEADNEPVIFDPAAFYGHAEYDLAIAGMFGGFSASFYDAYKSLIPEKPNFNERQDLYKLFHCLNHWNHFGGGYKGSTLSIMRKLLKIF